MASVCCYKVGAFNLNGDCPFSSEDDASLGQPDGDGDCAPNADDNCRDISNPAQTDTDSDGSGDACDDDDHGWTDVDGNAIGTDPLDNCAD